MQFRVERIACGQPLDLGAQRTQLVVVGGRQCRRDEVCHGAEVVVEKPRAASAGVPIRRPEVIIGDEGRRVPRCG